MAIGVGLGFAYILSARSRDHVEAPSASAEQ
jgi:hypothetical protein